jgi:hypothetical protein
MPDPELVGHGGAMNRDLFVLELESPEDLPDALVLSSAKFACLLAWDAGGVSADRVGRLARTLLDSGAVYVCSWGPDCERVHDILDEVDVGPHPGRAADGVVVTTWHSGDPLNEAIWFVLHASRPDDRFIRDCTSTLGLTIARPEWGSDIRAAFRAPDEFLPLED